MAVTPSQLKVAKPNIITTVIFKKGVSTRNSGKKGTTRIKDISKRNITPFGQD